MSSPSDPKGPPEGANTDSALERLMGLGDRSTRKSYFPQLKKKITELETFQLLVDRAVDAIFLLKVQPMILQYGNNAAANLVGVPREDLPGKSVVELFGEALALDSSNPLDLECCAQSLQVWIRKTAVEMNLSRHEIEGVPYIVVVARDVTDRLRAEQDLRQLKTLLEGIIESMPSSLIAVRADGTVTQWNRQAELLSGVSSAAALGQPLRDVMPRLSFLMPALEQAMAEQSPQHVLRQKHLHRNLPVFEDMTVFPLNHLDGGGAVIRIDNVTERVRLEEVMVQTEKMKSVGGLAAGMAHEIKNPLAGILQCAQNLRRRLLDDIPANVRAADKAGLSLETLRTYVRSREIDNMLTTINGAGLRVSSIVSSMLNFSRKSTSQSCPNDLEEIVENALQLASSDFNLTRSYDFRKIRVVREYDPDLPPVPCRATEIEQVVLNLLMNAAHAFKEGDPPEGGWVLTLRTMAEDDRVCLEVEDNGPGMPEEVRKNIFEPFFTTKEPGVGTGLGLWVSSFIITQAHSGDIAVTSTPGQGTRFTIHLPLSPRG